MVKYVLQNKLLQYPHVNEQLCLQLLYWPYLKMFLIRRSGLQFYY